jgi:hypothetical protein
VEFVKHEKLQALGRPNEILLLWMSQQEFQHHIVGEEDVGRRGNDLLFFLLRFLSRVARERYGAFAVGLAVTEKLFEFPILAVGQRVHGIHNECLNPTPATAPKRVIDYGDDIREAFSRSGPCR